MPRKKNTRPTYVYWLWDVRPETIAAGWPLGKAFYCGKTVAKPSDRLSDHRREAIKCSHRKICIRILEVGQYIRIQVMEVVPADQNWVVRERHWIKTLRLLHSETVNTTEGGEGVPGLIHGANAREKLKTANKGKIIPTETRLKISRTMKGRSTSTETRRKLSAANRGRKLSESHRKKMSVARKGKRLSAEHRAKMSASAKAAWASHHKRRVQIHV